MRRDRNEETLIVIFHNSDAALVAERQALAQTQPVLPPLDLHSRKSGPRSRPKQSHQRSPRAPRFDSGNDFHRSVPQFSGMSSRQFCQTDGETITGDFEFRTSDQRAVYTHGYVRVTWSAAMHE